MVEKLTSQMKKETTCMRLPLEVGLKLAVTLRFLATGDSFKSLQYSFKVAANAIQISYLRFVKLLLKVTKMMCAIAPKLQRSG